MNTIDDGGAAFPLESSEHVDGFQWAYHGMTLRDYFAAKAMPAVLEDYAISLRKDEIEEYSLDDVAKVSYQIADAMIGVREEKA